MASDRQYSDGLNATSSLAEIAAPLVRGQGAEIRRGFGAGMETLMDRVHASSAQPTVEKDPGCDICSVYTVHMIRMSIGLV
ncbi:hypothetical protein SeLEV6574_g01078 [Synchytrium endobioticum]|nr:hypothetical protein SeLEV6574_g01078 [Synchytrium endobioticum]